MRPGILFVVVGPSGVGKDTLIDGARAALARDPGVVFARRLITRPADAGGEDHQAVSEEELTALERAGGLLASWGAHGLRYGLPIALRDALLAGRDVIANGSRGALKALAAAVPRLVVLAVTASPDIVAKRLAGRGRESEAEIAARLARAAPDLGDGLEIVTILNDGAPKDGVAQLLTAIDAARRHSAATHA